MVGITKKAGRNKTAYSTYECSTRRNKKECNAKPISKEKLEQIVINTIETSIMSDIDCLTDNVYNYLQEKIKKTNTSLSAYKKELNKIEEKIKNIVEAIASGMFHISMKEKLSTLEEQKSKLVSLIAESTNSQDKITKPMIKMQLELNKHIKNKSYEEQKKIINSFVEKIIVFENDVEVHLIVTLLSGGEGYRYKVTISINEYRHLTKKFVNV
jgi:site-specific DNA recombinase